jgi:hypothetical protein
MIRPPWQEVISFLLVALCIAFLSFVAGVIYDTESEHGCHAGQVYVVDTDRCVDASDHGAHEGHGQ